MHGPFLIIGPLSTLRNWSGEFKRFCPSMNVLEYHGSGAKARAALRAEHMPLGELLNAHAQPWGSQGVKTGGNCRVPAPSTQLAFSCGVHRCAPAGGWGVLSSGAGWCVVDALQNPSGCGCTKKRWHAMC